MGHINNMLPELNRLVSVDADMQLRTVVAMNDFHGFSWLAT